MNPDHSKIVKTYLGFDCHLIERPGDPYFHHVRITRAGEPPLERYWLGGFDAKDKEELDMRLKTYEKILGQMHLRLCLSIS